MGRLNRFFEHGRHVAALQSGDARRVQAAGVVGRTGGAAHLPTVFQQRVSETNTDVAGAEQEQMGAGGKGVQNQARKVAMIERPGLGPNVG